MVPTVTTWCAVHGDIALQRPLQRLLQQTMHCCNTRCNVFVCNGPGFAMPGPLHRSSRCTVSSRCTIRPVAPFIPLHHSSRCTVSSHCTVSSRCTVRPIAPFVAVQCFNPLHRSSHCTIRRVAMFQPVVIFLAHCITNRRSCIARK